MAQQFFPSPLSRDLQVLPGIASRTSWNAAARFFCGEQPEGDVQFPDATQPARQPADSFLRLCAYLSHQGQHFADASRRDPRTVQGARITLQRGGELADERAHASFEHGLQRSG